MRKLKPPLYCGIDLGTTNSTVSIICVEKGSDKYKPMEKLESRPIYQYDENLSFDKDSIILPSAIYFDLDENQVYTGKYAKSMYASGDRPMQTIRSVKTRIGGESMVEIPAINNPADLYYFDMTQCSSFLARTIWQSIKKQFNIDIEEAVMTIPSAFNNHERQATINAFGLAGFKRCYILDEPTASLLYYLNGGEGDLFCDNISQEGEYKLVYDLGGGTLDVTVAKVFENEDGDFDIDILARSPRMDIGGDDFDQYLAGYFLSQFEKARTSIENRTMEEQSKIIARIVSQAEKYKIEMNDAIHQRIDNPEKLKKIRKFVNFEIISGMYIQDVELTKEIMDKIFSDLINNDILEPVKQSLKYAAIDKSQISEVLMTGGMSKFYAVEDSLKRFFGNNTRLLTIDHVSSVSKGAAIYHYSQYNENIKKLKLKDIMADDVFIKVGDNFELLFPRTTLPGQEGTFDYKIKGNGLADLPVFLYYGTGCKPEHYIPISGQIIPLNDPLKEGDVVKLKWELDKNKIIHLEFLEKEIKIERKKSKIYTCKQIDFTRSLKVN